ncbi:nitrate reductase [Actibacterium mucosum KCTC 23349]|uniref:Nitrate reductase n=1 Tax=Actibacterium mucosum KCTC 23349 TaxID=1454373 RepID=A0A037ZKU3_9RHOB|nr:nitrate reductase [Actibacterium mucosum]KAJ57066.1 nitrate reductase [Actibacterium mucosum KCTC 23349]
MDGAADQQRLTAVDAPAAIRTTCPYCGVGCGVLATPDGRGGLDIKGDPDHPANKGRLCSKGSALGETLAREGRLLAPQIGERTASWDDALDLVADRFRRTIAEHGPDSVAFYVSGQLLTEDYYVANKLMKGFIGSANIDTNSRLCMASSVAGHKRAFGTDTVPGQYEDLEEADLIVLVGSNLAWCHPVLFQRIVAAKAARPGMKVINVDPRVTATSDLADLHLDIAPGGDVALFNALLVALADGGQVDADYVARHVDGFDAALAQARADDADATGLSPEKLSEFLRLWTGTRKVVTIYSQGVNQARNGTDKVNAILNCHLATGRIGRPGMGPFSVTGQPNAMGGREVGGLANMLACHLDLENAEHRAAVKTFWDAPTIPDAPGAKAVDMFRKVGNGQIKAIWIMCTNPAVSMPDAGDVRAALRGCDFVVVSDMFGDTDTAKLAHVRLPATGWAEKDGTVTNSERRISRQRGMLPPPGQARHDWDVLSDVGRRMGWPRAFDYASPAEIFREYAAMTQLSVDFGKDLDLTPLAELSDSQFDAMAPVSWPLRPDGAAQRFFADGGFFTDTGRARMLPVSGALPRDMRDGAAPFRLNTGRVRDHWHTMSRTGMAPKLSQHLAEPYVEIHPADMARLNLRPADIATIEANGQPVLLRVMPSTKVKPGAVFAPIHWTDQVASSAIVSRLTTKDTDPFSGQPDSKGAAVSIRKFDATWYGFAVSASRPNPDCAYWALARTGDGWRAELAGLRAPANWEDHARQMFNLPQAEAVSLIDAEAGLARVALVLDGVTRAALFVAPQPVAVARSFLTGALGDSADLVLPGQPGAGRPDPGPTLCSCFGVGVNTITLAIRNQGLTSVEAIGEALQAGTNCGSCRPELAALLSTLTIPHAAE